MGNDTEATLKKERVSTEIREPRLPVGTYPHLARIHQTMQPWINIRIQAVHVSP
jgi:hypothetical protein